MEGDEVYVKVRLTRGEYEALKALARRRGYPTVADLLADAARRLLESGEASLAAAPPQLDERRLAEAVASRLERRLVDLINPFTGKIDELGRRVAELVEAVESLQAGGAAGVGEERGYEEYEAPQPPRPPRARAAEHYEHERPERARRGRGRGGGTALERLKSEGILVASRAPWIKDPDKFFSYLEREGVVVLDLGFDKVAVDPELWREFQEVVEALEIQDAEEAASAVEEKLGPAAGELFRLLVRSGKLYYDEDQGKWLLELPP